MRFLIKLDDFLLASLLVVLADVALFHAGAYFPFVQPESFSGQVEDQVRRVNRRIESFPGQHRILVMGNSATQASVGESHLETELADNGLRYDAINMAIGGSSPRAWYVLLKDGWISKDNTEVVVLGINLGSIQAFGRKKRADLDISKTRLKAADAWAMARAYRGLETRLEVFVGTVFRTLLFRDDVKQYLLSPMERRREVAEARVRFEAWMQAGGRVDNVSHDNLVSARLGKNGKLKFDQLDEFLKQRDKLRSRVQHMLRRRRSKLRFIARGKKETRKVTIEPAKVRLLGRLVDELNADGVKVVFSVLPISPYALGIPPEVDHLGNFFRDLKQRGADVAVWHDPELIRKLQAPKYYRDTLHLNAAGAEIYTRGLARFLASELKVQERLDSVGGVQDHRPDGDRQDRGP